VRAWVSAWVHDERRRRWLVGLVLLVGLVGRIALIVYVDAVDDDRAINPDTRSYVEPAEALIEEGRFTRSIEDDTPMFVRTPGYPAFLAVVRLAAGDSTMWPLVAQSLVLAAVGLLAYAIASRLFGPLVAVLTLVLVTLDPLLTALGGTLLTESVFTLWFVAAVYCLVRYLDAEDAPWRWAAATGVTLAAATLTRPTTYYLTFVVMVLVAARAISRRRGAGRTAAATLAFLLPVAALVGGWQLRNLEQVDSARPSSAEAINLYWFGGAYAIHEDTGEPINEIRNRLTADLYDDLGIEVDDIEPYRRGLIAEEALDRQGDVYVEAYHRGVEIILDHPVGFARVWAEGFGREMIASGKTEILGYYLGRGNVPGIVEAGAVAAIAVTWVVAFIGFVLALSSRRQLLIHLTVAGMGLYLLAASAGLVGEARIRAPLMPLVLMYAAAALVHGGRRVLARSEAPETAPAQAS
jgi:4-amino-4-deoxy-L-arabinose transferase-like glycosyltransferase